MGQVGNGRRGGKGNGEQYATYERRSKKAERGKEERKGTRGMGRGLTREEGKEE